MHNRRIRLLSILLPALLAAQPEGMMLQIRVIQGAGAVHTAGAKASRGLIVEITDEAGKPIEGAAVNFRLPDSGPGGLFANGLNSEIAISGPDGRASVYGMRWNRTPGPFEIRVTAAKGRARAGIVAPQYLAEPHAAATSSSSETGVVLPPYKPRRRWLTVTMIVAGAAAGTAAGLAFGKRSSAAAPSEPGVSVGAPSITIGGPQ